MPSMSPRSLGLPVARLLRDERRATMKSTSTSEGVPHAVAQAREGKPVSSVRMSMRPGARRFDT